MSVSFGSAHSVSHTDIQEGGNKMKNWFKKGSLILFLSGYVNLFTVLPKEIDLHRIYFFVSGLFYIALIISFSEMFIHLDIVRKLSRHRVLFLLYPLIIMGSCWFIPYKISIHANLVFIVLCIATSFYILQNKWGKISSFQRVYGITLLVFLVCWLGNSLSRFGILYLPFLSDDVLFYFPSSICSVMRILMISGSAAV